MTETLCLQAAILAAPAQIDANQCGNGLLQVLQDKPKPLASHPRTDKVTVSDYKQLSGVVLDDYRSSNTSETHLLLSKYYEALPEDKKRVLTAWKADLETPSNWANKYLRGNILWDDLPFQRPVQLILSELPGVINAAPDLPSGTLLLRGMNLHGKEARGRITKLQVGDTFHDPGFLATSLDPDVAFKFMRTDYADPPNGSLFESREYVKAKDEWVKTKRKWYRQRVLLVIRSKGDLKGAYIGAGRNSGEEEVVLGRGLNFTVTRRREIKYKNRSEVWSRIIVLELE